MTVWERRDLPVLVALASTEDGDIRSGFLDIDHARDKLGLDLTNAEINEAILTLGDAGYVTANDHFRLFDHLLVTGRGHQALGEWPLFTEVTPATLAALLDRLAAEAETDEEADNARKAATYVRSIPVAVFKSVLRTVIVESMKASIGFLT